MSNVISQLFANLGKLFNWVYVVEPWEQALRVRAGKHVKRIESGIHFRIPFIDAIYKQSVRKRACGTGDQTITTEDGKTITLNGSLRYRISDIEKMYLNVYNVSDTVRQEIQGLVVNYVISKTLAECTVAALQKHISNNIDLSKYGFADVDYFLTDFAVVKTYRLINDGIEKYYSDYVNMNRSLHGGSSEVSE